jgi:hypothetical protein
VAWDSTTAEAQKQSGASNATHHRLVYLLAIRYTSIEVMPEKIAEKNVNLQKSLPKGNRTTKALNIL